MSIHFKFYTILLFTVFQFLPTSYSRVSLQASNNKENFELCEDNFSKDSRINFKGLYKHIHYTFKNENLIQEALYPLLPSKQKLSKQKFEHLEFLGDAVLGLITRERILDLFPEESRKIHNELYEELTKNKTLSMVYQQSLRIEQYLPYPGASICQYCNIIEALIGAIFEDDQQNSLTQSRKFTFFILNDHILKEKWRNIQQKNPVKLQDDKIPFTPKSLPLSPSLKATFENLQDLSGSAAMDPKSILGMILGKSLKDQAEYYFRLGRNPEGSPGFKAYVVAAQIGDKILGFGMTRIEAEKEAARLAVNFLAGKEYLPPEPDFSQTQTYIKVIQEYCQIKNIQLPGRLTLPLPQFTYVAKWKEEIIGQGRARSKKEAAEIAASEAYTYFLDNNKLLQKNLFRLPHNYRMALNEWLAQGKIRDYQLIEEILDSPQAQYQLKIDNNVIIIGEGVTKKEAKDKAYKAAFEYFLSQQGNEKAMSYQRIEKKLIVKVPKISTTVITTVSSEDKLNLSKASQKPSMNLKRKKKKAKVSFHQSNISPHESITVSQNKKEHPKTISPT